MQKTLKMLASLALILAAVSCSSIQLENPMPRGGQPMTKIPEDWSGLFQLKTSSDDNQFHGINLNFLFLERIDDRHLLISAENRLRRADITNLANYLNQDAPDGQHIEFKLTNRFLFYEVRTKDETIMESRILSIRQEGDWIVLTNTSKPFMMIDLEKGRAVEYDAENKSEESSASGLLPGADSLNLQFKSLALRRKDDLICLNTRDDEADNWSFVVIKHPEKEHFQLILNLLKDRNEFKAKLDRYNAITALKEESDNYIANPSDKDFERLLAEPVFEIWDLTKVK